LDGGVDQLMPELAAAMGKKLEGEAAEPQVKKPGLAWL
jgi:hypothetical protein